MCIKISIEAQDLSMLGGHAPKWEFHPNPQIFYNLTYIQSSMDPFHNLEGNFLSRIRHTVVKIIIIPTVLHKLTMEE